MTLHGGVSISVHKATTLPLSLARDSNNNELIHERRTIQSLINSSKKPPYSRIDTILTNFFPEEYGEGFYGMEIGDVSCRPTFLQKMDLGAVDERSNPVLRTNHPNLLNLLDISLLHGLIYIHEALNVSHGHLHCDGIYLNDKGEIKIGDVGKSMIQIGRTKDVSRDVQAVFRIAGQLLSLESSTDTTSMSWIIAKNFVTMPSTVDPRTLLKHPFLKLSQDSWYLASLAGLLSFVQTTGLVGSSKSGQWNGDEKIGGDGTTKGLDKECLSKPVNSELP
uniref:Dual specificity mitogen-activated protein kinase kinase 2 n=1 Tax=Talaromyces marneffei PM1 TaxID=1077442 RepID=A0A093XBF0_TALMA